MKNKWRVILLHKRKKEKNLSRKQKILDHFKKIVYLELIRLQQKRITIVISLDYQMVLILKYN
jgi:hypothetical protein